MSKAPRKSPGVGRGENLASHEAINNALAMEVLDQEALETVREIRKRHRKNAEQNGVALSDLDDLYKSRDEPISNIVAMIRRKIHYLGSVFHPLRAQTDLFMQASASPEDQHAAKHVGKMAGLKGDPCSPPPALGGEDAQLWIDGHHEGATARAAALKQRKADEKTLADTLAAALSEPDGKTVDGTGKGSKAEQVRAQAAADFAKDNPEGAAAAGIIPPAEIAEEVDVEAEAKKLQENGFAPKPKPKAVHGIIPGERVKK